MKMPKKIQDMIGFRVAAMEIPDEEKEYLEKIWAACATFGFTAHAEMVKGLVEALESIIQYDQMFSNPEHEVRHSLCVEVPSLALETLYRYREAMGEK